MAKLPVAGRVKTRLAQDIGTVAATNFYRHNCRAVFARLSTTSAWHTVLCVTPDTAMRDRFWPRQLSKIKQGDGDLGQRMRHAMQHQTDGPVVLIGTDIPAVDQSHIADAFRNLQTNDFVFGPTPDGGFWLVGAASRRYLHRAFRHARWSTEFALQDTINSLQSEYSGLQIGLVAQLDDVDHGADLKAAASLSGRRLLPTRNS